MVREPPIAFSERDGIRYLHFGSQWIQGAMRLARPEQLALSYTQDMMCWLMLLDPPARVLQLGLGAGALTRFCLHHCPQSVVDVVERSRNVITACTQYLELDAAHPSLHVHRMDALAWLRRRASIGRHGVLQVDLYDEEAKGPVLDSEEFYRLCHRALDAPGVMTVNLFGREASFDRSEARIRKIFDQVLVLGPVDEGNVVLMATKGPRLQVGRRELDERAHRVRRDFGLRADRWARALRHQWPGPEGS